MQEQVMILAGDIGATNTRLALHEPGQATPRAEWTVPNREFPHFDAALLQGLDRAGRPIVGAAAIAVAGPVLDGAVVMTNLGWRLDEPTLSATLGGARVRLLNDLEAAAYGVVALAPSDFRALADPPVTGRRNVAVIAAGTGLGEALLVWDGDTPIAVPSEGGHADFAPRDETELALLAWLGRSREHVSWEHVLSGPGILWTYEFLRDTGRGVEPAALRAQLAAAVEPAIVITRAALTGEFPICVRTLEVFVRAYGAEAGNLALKGLALGGVYVAGGIAPDVLDGPWRDRFMQGFVEKGRYADLMKRIPVRVVLSEKASLVVAYLVASRL
jgi:glucokinase